MCAQLQTESIFLLRGIHVHDCNTNITAWFIIYMYMPYGAQQYVPGKKMVCDAQYVLTV